MLVALGARYWVRHSDACPVRRRKAAFALFLQSEPLLFATFLKKWLYFRSGRRHAEAPKISSPAGVGHTYGLGRAQWVLYAPRRTALELKKIEKPRMGEHGAISGPSAARRDRPTLATSSEITVEVAIVKKWEPASQRVNGWEIPRGRFVGRRKGQSVTSLVLLAP